MVAVAHVIREAVLMVKSVIKAIVVRLNVPG